MSDEIKVITNNIPRNLVDAYELTAKERKEFDYIDWVGVDEGTESAIFFRYQGTLYDLGEFMTTNGMPEFSPLRKWDTYLSDTFFSGIVLRLTGDMDTVVIGRFYC